MAYPSDRNNVVRNSSRGLNPAVRPDHRIRAALDAGLVGDEQQLGDGVHAITTLPELDQGDASG